MPTSASETSATTGATNSATCIDDVIAISVARSRVAALRDHDRAAVLGGVADDRDDHDGDEELVRPTAVPNACSECDEDLRDERGRERRDAERRERRRAATRRRASGAARAAS